MKYLVSLLIFLELVTVSLAQERNPGFIRFVNLIDFDGAGRTSFAVNGVDLFPKGYLPGQVTGGLGFQSGDLELKISHPGCKSVKETIPVKAGETQTVLSYAEPKFNEEGQLEAYLIKTARLQQRAPKNGLTLSLLSVVQVDGLRVSYQRQDQSERKDATLTPMQVKRIPLRGAETDISIFVPDEHEAVATFYPDKNGNYVVIFYSKGDGSIGACQFYDPKFVVAK